MRRIIRSSILVSITALALSACGGDDPSRDTPSDGDERSDARAGYFSEEQSTQLNPLLAAHDTAQETYYDGHDACSKEADRKFAAGSSARASVQCHLTSAAAYRDAVGAVRDGVADIDGDFRGACDEQREEFERFLDAYEASLATYHADWEAYAGGKQIPDVQAHSDAVDARAEEFVSEQVPAMSKACYTKGDRKAAGKE